MKRILIKLPDNSSNIVQGLKLAVLSSPSVNFVVIGKPNDTITLNGEKTIQVILEDSSNDTSDKLIKLFVDGNFNEVLIPETDFDIKSVEDGFLKTINLRGFTSSNSTFCLLNSTDSNSIKDSFNKVKDSFNSFGLLLTTSEKNSQNLDLDDLLKTTKINELLDYSTFKEAKSKLIFVSEDTFSNYMNGLKDGVNAFREIISDKNKVDYRSKWKLSLVKKSLYYYYDKLETLFASFTTSYLVNGKTIFTYSPDCSTSGFISLIGPLTRD